MTVNLCTAGNVASASIRATLWRSPAAVASPRAVRCAALVVFARCVHRCASRRAQPRHLLAQRVRRAPARCSIVNNFCRLGGTVRSHGFHTPRLRDHSPRTSRRFAVERALYWPPAEVGGQLSMRAVFGCVVAMVVVAAGLLTGRPRREGWPPSRAARSSVASMASAMTPLRRRRCARAIARCATTPCARARRLLARLRRLSDARLPCVARSRCLLILAVATAAPLHARADESSESHRSRSSGPRPTSITSATTPGSRSARRPGSSATRWAT